VEVVLSITQGPCGFDTLTFKQ